MTLQEAETKLSERNNHIAELLKERENVLKEWSIAFNTENKEKIVCCLYSEDTKRSIDDFLSKFILPCTFWAKPMGVALRFRNFIEISFMQKLWKLESMRTGKTSFQQTHGNIYYKGE